MEFNLQPYLEKTVKLLGLLLLLIGLIGLYYGPLEIYCFYMFSESGKFYYEGFQIGSLWFTYLVIQNAAYYIVALLLIPIGIGTFKLKEWSRKLSLNLLYIWIILGISLISGFILSIPQFLQKINLSTILIIFVIMVTGIFIPFIFTKIYKNRSFRWLFKNNNNWIDKIPQVILLICSLNLIFILFLHVSTLLQFIFPFFGKIILHREAVPYISSSIFILAILTYGIWIKYFLAFWGLIIYYVTMIITILMTFSQYRLSDIMNLLNLPSYEQTQIIPMLNIVSNLNIAAFIGSYLIIILLSCLYSRKYWFKPQFNKKNKRKLR